MQKNKNTQTPDVRYFNRIILANEYTKSIANRSKNSVQKQLSTQTDLSKCFYIKISKHLLTRGIKNEEGVYTAQQINKGTILGQYNGVALSEKALQKVYGTKDMSFGSMPYLMSIKNNEFVYPTQEDIFEAKTLQKVPLYFMNHDAKLNNCEIKYKKLQNEYIPFFEVNKTIAKDQELIVDYGKNFENFLEEGQKNANQVPFKTLADFCEAHNNSSNLKNKPSSKKRDVKAKQKAELKVQKRGIQK